MGVGGDSGGWSGGGGWHFFSFKFDFKRGCGSGREGETKSTLCHWELTVGLTSFFTEARRNVALEFAQRRRLQRLKIDLNLVRIRVAQRRFPTLDDVHNTAEFIACRTYYIWGSRL